MINDVSYASQWRELRRRTILSLAAFLSVPIAFGLASYLLKLIRPEQDDQFELAFGVAIPFFLLAVATGAYQASFPCPRCSKSFLSTDGWQNPYSRKCLHCGLRRGTELKEPS